MKEGEVLLKYIDNQKKSKSAIATDLGMSRRNLYGIFESATLAPETKEKFEQYFGEKIFMEGLAQEPSTSYKPQQPKGSVWEQTIADLAESSRRNSIANEINAKTIERLISYMERNIGAVTPSQQDPAAPHEDLIPERYKHLVEDHPKKVK